MSTDKKTIQEYNSFAKKWISYKKIQGKWDLANDYVEKPAMYGLVEDLKGKSVLCLGCGSGEECDYLKKSGAKIVVGVDMSKNLIKFAKKSIQECKFEVMDIENLKFPNNSFDIVYSSLALHYLKDWTEVLSKISKILKGDGYFLFSIPHPVKWAAKTTRKNKGKEASFLLGYSNDHNTGEYHIYGDYLNTRRISDKWFGKELSVSFYMKPFSAIFKEIRESGFQIIDLLEPKAIANTKKVNSVYWEIRNKIPLFMIFKLVKR